MHPILENIKAILCCPFDIIGLLIVSCGFMCCYFCNKHKGYEEFYT